MQSNELSQEAQTPVSRVRKPSIEILEKTLRFRLESFIHDVHDIFDPSVAIAFETLEEEIELKINQLNRYLNDVRVLSFFKENESILD